MWGTREEKNYSGGEEHCAEGIRGAETNWCVKCCNCLGNKKLKEKIKLKANSYTEVGKILLAFLFVISTSVTIRILNTNVVHSNSLVLTF